VENAGKILNEHQWLTISEMARRLGLSYETRKAINSKGGLQEVSHGCSPISRGRDNFLNMVIPPPPTQIHLIWPFVIPCFQERNYSNSGVVSRTSLIFRNNRRPSYTRYQKVSASRASSSGRNAGPVA
jgi:hypothetical protein